MSDEGVKLRKDQLRAEMKKMLEAMSPAEISKRSNLACANVLSMDVFRSARTVMVYAPLKRELDVTPIAAAWAMVSARHNRGSDAADWTHRLCVPALDWPTKGMSPAAITDWDQDLVLNRIGLREPRADVMRVDPATLDVVIVPGLAFDAQGRRLGRGGGFYDRFLSTLPGTCITIGVGFANQIVGEVPTDAHDARVHAVVSDERVHRAP